MVRELDVLRGVFQDTGFSYSQCHALFELQQHTSLTTNELAELLRLDKSTVSRLLSGLKEKGLVDATIKPSDQRQKAFRLTAEGRKATQCNNELADQQVRQALSLLDENERSIVERGLALYSKALRQSRQQEAFVIRKIKAEDNPQVAGIIRKVMTEFGAVGEGYSIQDPEVDQMYETYNQPGAAFFVVEKNGKIYGCGGIGPLVGGQADTCELKKMYFLPELRGMGWGKRMIHEALSAARSLGYQRCYLETVERMWQANALYQKMGFKKLDQPMGNTGHSSCEAYYAISL
jgi:putative acetyltransferase